MARTLAIVGTAVLMLVTNTTPAFARDESDMAAGADLTSKGGPKGEVATEVEAVSAEKPSPAPQPLEAVNSTVGSSRLQQFTIWDRLAECESTSRWHVASGNGFYGGLQFDRQTWIAYGGGVYAARADYASREQQILVAERLHAARGFQPWPACSRKLGLR